MKTKVLLMFMSVFVFQYVVGQTNEEIAKEKGLEAIKLMDEGHVDRSLELLKESEKLDPKSVIYPYEIAYAYYLKEDYGQVIKILKKLTKHKEVNDLVFKLLGNAYSMSGNKKEAIKTYESGLKKFRNSGKIYLELGVIHLMEEGYDKALAYFEKGIEVDPLHSSNYYWASKLFCTSSSEEVWGMIYGEIFMNLERNSRRTQEISKMLYDTYKSEIKIEGDTTKVSFSQNNVISFDGGLESLKIPYGIGVYEPTIILSLLGIKEISMQTLSDMRTRFVNIYFEKEYNKRYPNALFDYQRNIEKAGHLEAYNYWILMQGDQYEFMNWQIINEEKWTTFIDWFSNNPIQINADNKFIRQ